MRDDYENLDLRRWRLRNDGTGRGRGATSLLLRRIRNPPAPPWLFGLELDPASMIRRPRQRGAQRCCAGTTRVELGPPHCSPVTTDKSVRCWGRRRRARPYWNFGRAKPRKRKEGNRPGPERNRCSGSGFASRREHHDGAETDSSRWSGAQPTSELDVSLVVTPWRSPLH